MILLIAEPVWGSQFVMGQFPCGQRYTERRDVIISYEYSIFLIKLVGEDCEGPGECEAGPAEDCDTKAWDTDEYYNWDYRFKEAVKRFHEAVIPR